MFAALIEEVDEIFVAGGEMAEAFKQWYDGCVPAALVPKMPVFAFGNGRVAYPWSGAASSSSSRRVLKSEKRMLVE